MLLGATPMRMCAHVLLNLLGQNFLMNWFKENIEIEWVEGMK